MFERLIHNLDVFPGQKSYMLAGAAAILFFGKLTGMIPEELYNIVLPWILGAMGPTVALKLMR